MKKEIKKFLEFNGKVIYFITVDGKYWIAIKPICRALGVDYIQQFKNLKNDAILAPALCKHTMQAPDNQLRNYLCLPEFFVYGWLMGIQSDAPGLVAYKWECYRVLFEHFHGAITGRKELIKMKAQTQIQIDSLKNKVYASEEARQLFGFEKTQKAIDKSLRLLDHEQFDEELELFKQNITEMPKHD
jgi:hypothetical protein